MLQFTCGVLYVNIVFTCIWYISLSSENYSLLSDPIMLCFTVLYKVNVPAFVACEYWSSYLW